MPRAVTLPAGRNVTLSLILVGFLVYLVHLCDIASLIQLIRISKLHENQTTLSYTHIVGLCICNVIYEFVTHALGNTVDPHFFVWATLMAIFAQISNTRTLTKGFDARLANRPFSFFDFRTLWRSALSARVSETQKLKKMSVSLVSNP